MPSESAAASPTLTQQDSQSCLHQACSVKRVARSCRRRMCHKHCRSSGGCVCDRHFISPELSLGDTQTLSHSPMADLDSSSPSSECGAPSHIFLSPSLAQIDPALHPPSTRPGLSIPPVSSAAITAQPQALRPSSPQARPSFPPTSVPAIAAPLRTSTPAAPSSLSSIQAFLPNPTNPRFASHLRPVFIEHVANAQAHAEEKRRRDAEQLQHRRQAAEHVVAFSFPNDGAEPLPVDFQEFDYPYFKLSRVVLVELELASPDEQIPCDSIHYFNPDLDCWVKMKVGSTLTIAKPGQRLFFKAVHVKMFPAFDHLYNRANAAFDHNPNLCTMLPQERKHIKHQMVKTNLTGVTPVGHPCDVIEISSSDDDDTSTVVGVTMPRASCQKDRSRQTTSSTTSSFLSPPCTPRCDLQPARVAICTAPLWIPQAGAMGEERASDLESAPAAAQVIPGVPSNKAKFPASFYAVDVHRSFSFERKGNLTLETQFERFFGVTYRSSTYYDHKARWFQAP
ncbi:hypothetical protein OG21DRAFT_841531 [Imleria badia]|nr:hypothetical protein OG21DRAFT_841531 [Imleria badia]